MTESKKAKENGGEDPGHTQLATRVTRRLHKRLKLHCVEHNTSVMAFVDMAITAALDRAQRKR